MADGLADQTEFKGKTGGCSGLHSSFLFRFVNSNALTSWPSFLKPTPPSRDATLRVIVGGGGGGGGEENEDDNQNNNNNDNDVTDEYSDDSVASQGLESGRAPRQHLRLLR